MINTTIFTCCNGIYKDFVPFFILSSLTFNKKAFVEVGVDVIDEDLKKSIDYLYKINTNFLVREVKFKLENTSTCPNVIRFITEPQNKNTYLYISDVDIINLENLIDFHLENMKRTGLNYSNIIRPKGQSEWRRMTGLHFTKWNKYYPIGNIDKFIEMKIMAHDEVFLYEFVKSKEQINYEETIRPVHGIHISPNRDESGWGIPKWKSRWDDFRNSKEFKELELISSEKIRECFRKIDNYNISKIN
jgi:hypothetical protein